MLLIILAVLPVLFLAPLEPGAIRVSSVGLAWWYGGIVGELLALIAAIAFFGAPRAR